MVEAIRQGDIPGVQLRCRRQLAVSPERVWSWLTESEKLPRWLADRSRVEGGADGPAILDLTTEGEPLLRERGVTISIEPGRHWVLSFERLDSGWTARTRLTFGLSSTLEGCEAMVFHEGFERLSLSLCMTAWEQYRRRWRAALARLEGALGD